jgi:hypothetical protein
VTTACGCAAIGAAVASNADGCGAGVTSGGFGDAVACGCGVREAALGTTLGFGNGAAVGGALMLTAAMRAGTLVGTVAGIGAGLTAISACVGKGFGTAELSGAGVGFGGPLGEFFASSCTTRGCGGADRGCAASLGCGTTCACGGGTAARVCVTGAGVCGTACVSVTSSLPANDSGDACCDDDVAAENKKYASNA